jgi:hypothetical protein
VKGDELALAELMVCRFGVCLFSSEQETFMRYHISQTLRQAVLERIERAETDGRYLNVYEAAHEIQAEYPRENTALEDIVAALVDCAGGRSLAIELSQPVPTGHIRVDVVVLENS